MDPRVTHGLFAPGRRIYPRDVGELSRWAEILERRWEHPSKYKHQARHAQEDRIAAETLAVGSTMKKIVATRPVNGGL